MKMSPFSWSPAETLVQFSSAQFSSVHITKTLELCLDPVIRPVVSRGSHIFRAPAGTFYFFEDTQTLRAFIMQLSVLTHWNSCWPDGRSAEMSDHLKAAGILYIYYRYLDTCFAPTQVFQGTDHLQSPASDSSSSSLTHLKHRLP